MNGFKNIFLFYLKKQLTSKSFFIITAALAAGLSALTVLIGSAGTGGGPEMSADDGLYILSMIFCMVTMVLIMLYSNSASGEIAFLKTNRIMEIFMTSVKPLPLYLGINFAYCIAQLIQVGIVMLVMAIVNAASGSQIAETAGLILANGNLSGIFAVFIVFLISGYFVYSFLNTALVSVVGRAEDISGITVPISFIAMIMYIVSMMVSVSGDSQLAAAASYIPFTSPSVMVTRYIYGYADITQVVISAAVIIATAAVIAAAGARFFAGGVNFYGTLKTYRKSKSIHEH